MGSRPGRIELPTPPQVVSQADVLLGNGTLLDDVVASLGRVLAGFALGTAWRSRSASSWVGTGIVRGLVEPWIQVSGPSRHWPSSARHRGDGHRRDTEDLRDLPGSVPRVRHLDVPGSGRRRPHPDQRGAGARAHIAGIFVRMMMAASTPFILVGMRVGLGSAWATLVAAESIAAQQGLGYRMQNASSHDLQTISSASFGSDTWFAHGQHAPAGRSKTSRMAGAPIDSRAQDLGPEVTRPRPAPGHLRRARPRLARHRGERVVTVVGPSGCGKSALLNILAGWRRQPRRGKGGRAAVSGPGPERGVIFQQFALLPWLTVRENVEFGLRTRGPVG